MMTLEQLGILHRSQLEAWLAVTEETVDGMNRLKQEMLSAERAMVIRLRNQGTIGDEVMHRIERDLDLEEVRLASS